MKDNEPAVWDNSRGSFVKQVSGSSTLEGTLRDELPICHMPKCPANYVGMKCDCELGDVAVKVFKRELQRTVGNLIDSDWSDVYAKSDTTRWAVTQAKANYKEQLRQRLSKITGVKE